MSSGQKPRWPQYFPRMKQRGRYRKHRPRFVFYDETWNPVWPSLLHGKNPTLTFETNDYITTLGVDGLWYRIDKDREMP